MELEKGYGINCYGIKNLLGSHKQFVELHQAHSVAYTSIQLFDTYIFLILCLSIFFSFLLLCDFCLVEMKYNFLFYILPVFLAGYYVE